jgi:long-chain fatty acid transport protein
MQENNDSTRPGIQGAQAPAWRLMACLCLSLVAGGAHASAFQLAEQNASGLANSYAGSAAIAEDASTIFYNPAGMTRLPGLNVSAGATVISTTFKFSDNGSAGPGGLPLGTDTGGNAGSVNLVPNAYLSWQASPRWFVGLGVGAPFGLSTHYGDGWVGRYQSTKFSIETINLNPSVAYQVSDRLSIGAGLNWQYLNADYRRDVPAVFSQNVFPDMHARAKLSGDAWGWNLGLLYQVTDQTRLGLSYRSALRYSSSGTTTLQDIPGAVAGQIPASVDSSARFTLPDQAILSVVHDLNSRWQLLGDVSWTGWSRLPSLAIDNGALGEDRLQLQFRDTWRVALGVNYQYTSAWKLKAGVGYDQSPIPSSALRPTSLPDNDRISVSLGAQYRLSPQTTIDVGYSHLFFHATIDNGTDPKKGRVTGDWKTAADLIGMQVSHRF